MSCIRYDVLAISPGKDDDLDQLFLYVLEKGPDMSPDAEAHARFIQFSPG